MNPSVISLFAFLSRNRLDVKSYCYLFQAMENKEQVRRARSRERKVLFVEKIGTTKAYKVEVVDKHLVPDIFLLVLHFFVVVFPEMKNF